MRAVPEILMAPYLCGFDTLAHYVPTSLLWLNGGVSCSSYIATAPLFYSVVVSLVWLGGPLFTVLKIVPCVLHGFLGLSIFGYAKIGLGWSSKKSIVPALIGTLYFVALRISWDLLREELALVCFFAVLMLLAVSENRKFSLKRWVLLSLAMIAVVSTDQLVAALMLVMVVLTMVYKTMLRKQIGLTNLILFSSPSILLFLLSFYFSPSVPEYRLIFGFPSNSDGWLQLFGYSSYPAFLTNEAGFFIYCFLPILPLVAISYRRIRNFQLRSWIVLIFIALFIPMVSPSNLRWAMMLIYPLAFYATETLSKLKSINWKHFNHAPYRASVIYLVCVTMILSFGFTLMPPEKPFVYFDASHNSYIYQIPSSMLQNTLSKANCNDTVNSLQWFKDNVKADSLMLTHRAFYGWAISLLDKDRVVLYEYDNPANAAETVIQNRHSQIYLIWWVDSYGWYEQPNVPSSFTEVYHSGKIAIYQFVLNA